MSSMKMKSQRQLNYLELYLNTMWSEVLTAVTISYNVTPCSLVEAYWRFGGIHCLSRQGWNVCCTTKQNTHFSTCFQDLLSDADNQSCGIFRHFGKRIPDWMASLLTHDTLHIYSLNTGRAVAQAFSRWLHTEAARVLARVWSWGICGRQSGAGAGFLRVLWFPLPIFIPPIAPQSPSSIIWRWYNSPIVAAVPSGLNLTSLIIIIIIIIII
jgi:hypothetical protein